MTLTSPRTVSKTSLQVVEEALPALHEPTVLGHTEAEFDLVAEDLLLNGGQRRVHFAVLEGPERIGVHNDRFHVHPKRRWS
jgi:hypothetical protein